MGSTAVTVVVALISGFTGTGIAAIITAITSWRKGVREQDVSEDQTALDGYKALVAEYKADLTALKHEISDMKGDIAQIQKELSAERSTRWAAVQYARDLVSLIARRDPDVVIPRPPDSLVDHIIIPSRKDPTHD